MSNASFQSMSDFCWEVISDGSDSNLVDQAREWLKQDALRRQNAQQVADQIRASFRNDWFGR